MASRSDRSSAGVVFSLLEDAAGLHARHDRQDILVRDALVSLEPDALHRQLGAGLDVIDDVNPVLNVLDLLADIGEEVALVNVVAADGFAVGFQGVRARGDADLGLEEVGQRVLLAAEIAFVADVVDARAGLEMEEHVHAARDERRLDGDLREVAQGVDGRDGGPRRLLAVQVPFAEADGVADAARVRSGRSVHIQPDDLPPLAGLFRSGLGDAGCVQGDQREESKAGERSRRPWMAHPNSRAPSVLLSNRMNWRRNARFTLPVGPFRCLAMISSAEVSSV